MNRILLIIIFLLFNYTGYLNINRYNKDAEIVILTTDNTIDIIDAMDDLNPLILKNSLTKCEILNNSTLQKLLTNNVGYIINDNNKNISFDSFEGENNISLYHNSKCIDDFNIKTSLDKIFSPLDTHLTCNTQHYMNIFKGNQKTKILKQINNTCMYSCLDGKCTFYLINPKYLHNNEFNYNNPKKWSNKIVLSRGEILSIPANWDYYYESEEELVMTLSVSDKYNTYLYNLFK